MHQVLLLFVSVAAVTTQMNLRIDRFTTIMNNQPVYGIRSVYAHSLFCLERVDNIGYSTLDNLIYMAHPTYMVGPLPLHI